MTTNEISRPEIRVEVGKGSRREKPIVEMHSGRNGRKPKDNGMESARKQALREVEEELKMYSAETVLDRLGHELEKRATEIFGVNLEKSGMQKMDDSKSQDLQEMQWKIDRITDVLAQKKLTEVLFDKERIKDDLNGIRTRINELNKKMNAEETGALHAYILNNTLKKLYEKQEKLIALALKNIGRTQKKFLKETGAIGGTRTIRSDIKGIPRVEKTKDGEEVETVMIQSLEEKKLIALQGQLEQTKGQYDKLSFFQRMFGEGLFLKKRLERIRAQIDIVKPKVAEQRLYEPIRHAGRFARGEQEEGEPKELTTAKHIENPWQLYQARLAELDSWQSKRKKLSWLPWKDRAEKQRIDEFIAVIEKEVVQSKELYEKDVRERSLERDAQTIQREKEHFTKTG